MASATTAAATPVDVNLVFNLPSLGISADAIGFRNLTISSDQAMCIRDEAAQQITIVDIPSGKVKEKVPLAGAEAASVSPNGKLIAVRAQAALKVFNLELKRQVKVGTMPAGETVEFWKWVSDTTLGIVTKTKCYHWSTEGTTGPTVMFERIASLAGTQIINYAVSADNNWLMVTGIKPAAAGDGSISGATQLYSVEHKQSQSLAAYAGCFGTVQLAGRKDKAVVLSFVEEKKPENAQPKVYIMEVRRAADSFRAPVTDLPMPADAIAGKDFPMSVQVSAKHDFLYIFTKLGYVYIFDIHTGQALARHKITDLPIFATTAHGATSGALAITAKSGQVILVQVSEKTLIPYIINTLKKRELGMALAGRLGLPGADELYAAQLEAFIKAGDVERAARLAATSPGGQLRTAATVARFQAMPAPAGGQLPVLRYFSVLMEQVGTLNKAESVALAQPAIAQGKVQVIERFLQEGKIQCSAALGDMVAPHNAALALEIYRRSGEAHEKVVNCYMSMGQFQNIVPYAVEQNYAPNWTYILQHAVSRDPAAALTMAKGLYKAPNGALVDIPTVVNTFMQFQRLSEATSFLLDALAGDKEEEAAYQTQVLELNLAHRQLDVVEAIFNMNMFHHFDKARIAGLAEQAGMFQRALELFTSLEDIQRVLHNAHSMDPEFLSNYLGNLEPADCLACLRDMLRTNPRGNLQHVVTIATKYSKSLTPEALIAVFEDIKSFEGLFYYLGSIVNVSENPEVHFKYIVAAAKMKQYKEVERVCRDSTVYEPERVKEFLLDAHLEDPRALIHVGDRHGYVAEVTRYLWRKNHRDFIVIYVQKVRPTATPVVVGQLLDLDADEEFIKELLQSVRGLCPVGPLVAEVESRNRLRMLTSWLEALVADGSTDVETHNAIGKIYVMLNKDPQHFLAENPHYDSAVLGKFCEKLDPYLAFLAYKRAADHSCDEALLEVTNANGLFKDQARYLVERQDPALWSMALQPDNPFRRDVIDEVTGTALQETKDADAVSATVKAFMESELPNELIGLLEKLVLQRSDFSGSAQLQNLLLITSIRCSNSEEAVPGRTMEYIQRLDNYNGPEIAKIALRDDFQLYEEAYTIYDKFDDHESAVDVLLDQMEALDQAAEYAERVNKDAVWSKLAAAQLRHGAVTAAIDCFIKAGDPAAFRDVINASSTAGTFEELVKYLEMCRAKGLKERLVDTELVYALAKVNRLGDLELFISGPNVADIQAVGDRCFAEELFEAARLLFSSNNNNARLASTLVHLGLFREAVDAAKKANSIRTWKEVNAACVAAQQFRLAQLAGVHIIVSPDHLDELIAHYEQHGYFDELIKLMQQGLGLESAHKGIFTELGVLFAKYQPDQLMDHIRVFWSSCNLSRLLRACEEGLHWKEATYLYRESKDYDSAVRVMIQHAPTAFEHTQFLDVVKKVRNQELFYQAVRFYLDTYPMLLAKLLTVLQSELDHKRVVAQLRKNDDLPLVLDYLCAVQPENIAAVNEAINEIYVDEEDYNRLRTSVSEFDNFDQIALAQRIEKHELLEFRRIAATLYKVNRRWEESINLSKADRMFKDAINTTAESRKQALAEDLLRFFVGAEDKDCFCATLYTCYDLIRPDVALELAWRNRLMDYAMPFMIQFMRNLNTKVEAIDARTTAAEETKGDDEAAAEEAAAAAAGFGAGMQPIMQLTQHAHNGGMPMGGMPMPIGGGVPMAGPMGGRDVFSGTL